MLTIFSPENTRMSDDELRELMSEPKARQLKRKTLESESKALAELLQDCRRMRQRERIGE